MSEAGEGPGSGPGPQRTRVTLCPGGPMLIRGAAVVEAEDGTLHETHRPVSAICRCGATSRSPWCDGTHQLLGAASKARS